MAFKLRNDAEDEIRDEALPKTSDVISAADAFPESAELDAEDEADESAGRLSALPGPLIAAVTFVPTFLAVFFTLSSLMGATSHKGPSADAGVSTALKSDPGTRPAPTLSEAVRDPFVAPPILDSTPPSDPREALRGPVAEDAPVPTIESTKPWLPPAPPRVSPSPVPEPRVTRAPEPPRQPQAAVLNAPERAPAAAPAVEIRKGGRDWTPAAAFADREAAARLASSIQQQGYPVEIRQDQSATRPWVVWIGAQPRGGDRRR
ncbi:MAG TPA: hypothetical protein VK746_01460 [Candidatus Eisenbacteria bacterium]|nr:hypothetical protein [Candidatus Eisenbacteria bacterium]